MSVVALADDHMVWLDLLSQSRRVGSGAAMMWTDQQAAGGQLFKQFVESVTFEVTGQEDGAAAAVQYGGEAGFVVSQFSCPLALQKVDLQFCQPE